MPITEAARKNHEMLFPNHQLTLERTDPELVEVFDNFAFDEVLRPGDLEPSMQLGSRRGSHFQSRSSAIGSTECMSSRQKARSIFKGFCPPTASATIRQEPASTESLLSPQNRCALLRFATGASRP